MAEGGLAKLQQLVGWDERSDVVGMLAGTTSTAQQPTHQEGGENDGDGESDVSRAHRASEGRAEGRQILEVKNLSRHVSPSIFFDEKSQRKT
jgi:hypothetical protein